MTATFLEDRIGVDIKPVMSGGARFATEIKTGRSGHEFRNRRWAEPLREYSMSYGARSMDDVLITLEFSYKTAGSWLGFRMKDWVDFKSCPPLQDIEGTNQSLGLGDGNTYYFRINKRYSATYTRRIYKPRPSTMVVFVNGSALPQTEWFVDSINGIIVFKDPPANTAVLTWGGEFDVPVRFEEDVLEVLTHFYQCGETGNIGIREVRIKEDIDVAAYDVQRAAL